MSASRPGLAGAPALPPGTRILSNSAVAPGAKMLAKDGWQVALLSLGEPTEGYDFDTIIVSPLGCSGRERPRSSWRALGR